MDLINSLQNNWLFIISLIISCFALWFSYRALQIKEREEQDRRKDMRKAKLRAELINKPSSNFYLRIENRGKAKARSIEILIDDKSLAIYRPFVRGGLGEREIPQELDSGARWEPSLACSADFPPKFKIKLSWSDESNEPGSFENLLLPIED